MIISAPTDYRRAAERRLPRFLFDFIDGGAVTERTMKQNVEELASINLRQRVLTGAGTPSLETEIMAQKWALPIALGPVGATGMCARRHQDNADAMRNILFCTAALRTRPPRVSLAT
jgi:L-lactate dehydrogenase (cytochrome)